MSEYARFESDVWTFTLSAGRVEYDTASRKFVCDGFTTRQGARRAVRRCEILLAAMQRKDTRRAMFTYCWEIVGGQVSLDLPNLGDIPRHLRRKFVARARVMMADRDAVESARPVATVPCEPCMTLPDGRIVFSLSP